MSAGGSTLWLALSPLTLRGRDQGIIQWLKRPGDPFAGGDPLARVASIEIEAPAGLSGRIEALLAEDGSNVRKGEPLARIIVDQPWRLEESRTAFEHGHPRGRSTMATIMSQLHMSKLAWAGGFALGGLVTFVCAVIAFLLFGGLAAPMVAAMSMAIVAGAVSYAEYIMDRGDDTNERKPHEVRQ